MDQVSRAFADRVSPHPSATPAALRARYPRLITVDISGYGTGHSYAEMKAYDLLVQAESGLAAITGHPAGPGRVSSSRGLT